MPREHQLIPEIRILMLSSRSRGSTSQAKDEPELSREQKLHPEEGLLEATRKGRHLPTPRGKYSGKGAWARGTKLEDECLYAALDWVSSVVPG